MPHALQSTLRAAPVLAWLLLGLGEWFALTRSRGTELLAGTRRILSRR